MSADGTVAMNPRYLNYCRAHGKTPDEMLEHDRKEWPGGVMAGFILWHKARLGESMKALPGAWAPYGLTDHAAYDAWLTARVDEMLATPTSLVA